MIQVWRGWRLGLLSLLMMLGLLGAGRAWHTRPPPQDIRAEAQTAGLTAQLRPGDLLFRRGSGTWSRLFAGASTRSGFFSHVGLVVRRDQQWWVLHSEADELTGLGGVRQESLDRYLTHAQGFALVRLRLPQAAIDESARLAQTRHWQTIPFDSAFTLEDQGAAMYCTEWVWALLRQASQVDISPHKTSLAGRTGITADDLLYGPYAELLLERRLPVQP